MLRTCLLSKGVPPPRIWPQVYLPAGSTAPLLGCQQVLDRLLNGADEDEDTYVYIDLSELETKDMPAAGATVTLEVHHLIAFPAPIAELRLHCSEGRVPVQGLDTDAPLLHLPGGQTWQGQYEEALGSLMLFTQHPRPASAPPGQQGHAGWTPRAQHGTVSVQAAAHMHDACLHVYARCQPQQRRRWDDRRPRRTAAGPSPGKEGR